MVMPSEDGQQQQQQNGLQQKKSSKEGVQLADAENVYSQYKCSQISGKVETHRDRAHMLWLDRKRRRHGVRGSHLSEKS